MTGFQRYITQALMSESVMFSFKLLATQVEGGNKKQKMKSERGNGGLNHAGSLYRLQFC